jgi:hypothetical protein
VKRCADLLKPHRVYAWNDMFDPYHNAVKGPYYLVNGDLTGSWEGLGNDVVIMNWNEGQRDKSLKFFAGRSHKQVIATYYDDPSLALHRLVDRDGTPYLLLTGPEPDFQWERMTEAVRQLVVLLGVNLVVSAHGIPMAVPHTRPIGLTSHATDPRLIPLQDNPFGRVEVPASLSSLLELRLGESGHDALGFAVHVPHYLAQAEFADGAVTALNAVTAATGLNLPIDDLVAQAGLNRAEIAREIEGSDEVSQVIAALERQYDTFSEGRQKPSLLATDVSELPSADEIGAEFEQFLRDVADDEAAGEGNPS